MKRFALVTVAATVLTAFTLVLPTSGAQAASTDAPRKTFSGCPKVILYGVRGVQEKLGDNVGLGGPLYELFTKMQFLTNNPSQVGPWRMATSRYRTPECS